MDVEKRSSELIASRGRDPETDRVRASSELFWEYVTSEHPEVATQFGYPGSNHRWTDWSLDAIDRRKKGWALLLEVVESVDAAELGPDVRLDYDLLTKNIEREVESAHYPSEYLQFGPLGGPDAFLAQIVAITPAFTRSHYEDILSRLKGIPAFIEQSLALLEKGVAEGITSPRVVVRTAPDQVAAQIVEDPMTSPLLKALQEFPPGFSEKDGELLRNEASKIFREEIVPAYNKMREYVAETYLPACRESIALADLANGEDWYTYLVRRHTTTDLSPKEIHEIGQSEVERIRGAMEDAKSATGFTGSFEKFFGFLREDPQFYFEDGDDLLSTYRDICKRADPELAKLFGKLPRLPYGVIAVPGFMEKTAPTAYYQPGSLQAGRSAYFYANTFDLGARPKWEMEALSLHEAVPGHHLQIALAQEMEDVPEFRKFTFYTAYVEGWGLYAESLGEEMGFYEDPYSKFGQLTYEMWRAIRLVVDTGMHAFGWTRDQAIDFFKENAGKAEHDIVVEVDRYIAWPGQALAYKIGELKLKELRRFAARELGSGFDVRAFHDELLRRGALPLDVLEELIKSWVQEQTAQAK